MARTWVEMMSIKSSDIGIRMIHQKLDMQFLIKMESISEMLTNLQLSTMIEIPIEIFIMGQIQILQELLVEYSKMGIIKAWSKSV